MRIIDISADITDTPVYPGDPPTTLTKIKSIAKGDDYNLTAISASSHGATHIDAPLHFLETGKSIGELDIDVFIGDCRVVAVYDNILTGDHIDAMNLKGVKRLIIKGFGKSKLSRSAAYALAAEEQLLLVGIDMQSIAEYGDEAEVHRTLLSAGIIILEGLKLGRVQSGDYILFAPPVLVGPAEGAFCRAVLVDVLDKA